MIPYGRHNVTEEDIDAVVEVLRSDFLTQGAMVPEFEKAIEKYCNVKYAVAVNSATSALHVACMALGLESGDWLWTSPITFVASANCGRYCGAQIDFVDIDHMTWNLDVDVLSTKLKQAKVHGKLPKVLVAVHFTGQSCNMQEINRLSREYGFKVIEDASHAIGAKYLGGPVGCCEYSDITVFSFHPVKIITTGEGGVATTNDSVLARKMSLLRSHGITREYSEMMKPSKNPWNYEQNMLGYNYRMTDIHAALGLSQMARLDDNIKLRQCIAARYIEAFSSSSLQLPFVPENYLSSWHLFIVRLHKPLLRDKVFNQMRQAEIGVNMHYIPVYLQPYYANLGPDVGYNHNSFPESLHYYREAITLPIFPNLEFTDQELIISTLKNII